MPFYKKYQKENAAVALWRIEESKEELSFLVGSETMSELAALGYGSDKRRVEWLAVRVLLAHLFGEAVRLKYHGDGRPFVEGFSGDISISHTSGWVAVAISADGRIGVDVELRSRNALNAASHFVRDEQLQAIESSSPNEAALLCWIAKEALFKVVGNLGGNFKENISVAPFKMCEEGIIPLSIVGLPSYPERQFNVSYFFENEIAVAVVRE